jgi:hypothetical protein
VGGKGSEEGGVTGEGTYPCHSEEPFVSLEGKLREEESAFVLLFFAPLRKQFFVPSPFPSRDFLGEASVTQGRVRVGIGIRRTGFPIMTYPHPSLPSPGGGRRKK